MTLPIRFLAIPVAAAVSLALAACSSGPKIGAGAPPVVITDVDVEAIAQLLDRGEVADARKRLNTALRQDPMNPSLLVLRQGIVGDAKADLGPTGYTYTVAAGDTMASLAQQLLGNRLKSYQLARYNDIENPDSLVPGQVLKIPGQPIGAGSDRRATTDAAPSPRPSSAPAATAQRSGPVPPPAETTTRRAADAAGAQQSRTAGLAALNKGDISEAVALLQRAAMLDPGNAAIERDLGRARRIAATVRSRR